MKNIMNHNFLIYGREIKSIIENKLILILSDISFFKIILFTLMSNPHNYFRFFIGKIYSNNVIFLQLNNILNKKLYLKKGNR